MKVFFDTNVLVAAFATRGLCADLFRHVLAGHELAVGERVLLELRRVLRRKLGAPPQVIEEIEAFVREQAEIAPAAAESTIRVANDPDDARILAEAIGADADVLVTGDRDLLELTGIVRPRIVRPRELWELLREGP